MERERACHLWLSGSQYPPSEDSTQRQSPGRQLLRGSTQATALCGGPQDEMAKIRDSQGSATACPYCTHLTLPCPAHPNTDQAWPWLWAVSRGHELRELCHRATNFMFFQVRKAFLALFPSVPVSGMSLGASEGRDCVCSATQAPALGFGCRRLSIPPVLEDMITGWWHCFGGGCEPFKRQDLVGSGDEWLDS